MMRQLRKSAAAISFYKTECAEALCGKPISGAITGQCCDVIFELPSLYCRQVQKGGSDGRAGMDCGSFKCDGELAFTNRDE